MHRLDSLLGALPLTGTATSAGRGAHADRSRSGVSQGGPSGAGSSSRDDSASKAMRDGGSLLPSGLAQDLGADLPQGHVHVWGGPQGAGKTAVLLGLLHDAALRGRSCVYATYDLGAPALALRLLSMAADVPLGHLPDPHAPVADGTLTADEKPRAAAARRALNRLPIHFLEARGFGVGSLIDRLVRLPQRPEVLVVDYLQAVVRGPDVEPGATLRALADVADHLHLAVLCVFREGLDLGVSLEEARAEVARTGGSSGETTTARLREQLRAAAAGVDRVGWLEPAETPDEAPTPARIAEILANRHGDTRAVPFELDPGSGRVGPR